MFYILLIISGATAGFAVNRGTDRRFDDEVAAVMGAGIVLVCYMLIRLLPLLIFVLKFVLILAVIAGAAAALYFVVRKR